MSFKCVKHVGEIRAPEKAPSPPVLSTGENLCEEHNIAFLFSWHLHSNFLAVFLRNQVAFYMECYLCKY